MIPARVLVLFGLLACGGCTKHHQPPKPVEGPVVVSDTNPWHVLAGEIDDASARSLCAGLPEAMRAGLAAAFPADMPVARRLELIKARQESLDRAARHGTFEEMRKWERPALAALCLAEPIALGAASAEQTEASVRLLAVHDRIDQLASVREPVDSPIPVPARGDEPAVSAAIDAVRSSSGPMRAHLLAMALRAELPSDTLEELARTGGSIALRTGGSKRARAIFETLVRTLGPRATADDWASLALARFATRALEEGDLALARAQALARPPTEANRLLRARLRTVTRAREAYAELSAMPAESLSVEVALRRAGIYSRLDRHGEARGSLLAFDSSRDARVAGRMARIVLAESNFRGDWAAAAREADGLLKSAAAAPGREGEYWSVRLDVDMILGLVSLMTQAPAEGTVKPGAPSPLFGLLRTLEADGQALEPFNAGRGAIVRYAFSADGPAVHAVREREAWIAQATPAYEAALKLRAQYPVSSTAHRLVYALAPAAGDARAAFEQVSAPPPVDPEDDVDLYLQRARSGLDLAASARDRAMVGRVRAWAESVPARDGVQAFETMRATLLAEAWALDAVLGGGDESFRRARDAYALVARGHALTGADQNNALFVSTHTDSMATWTAQLTTLRDDPVAPWPERLNALLTLRAGGLPDADVARHLDLLLAAESTGGRAPARALWAWRAALASRLGDRPAAARFAARALRDSDDLTLPGHAPDGLLQEPMVGLPIEMSLGPEGPLLSFLPAVRRAPWLLPPYPLSKAELVALAGRRKP